MKHGGLAAAVRPRRRALCAVRRGAEALNECSLPSSVPSPGPDGTPRAAARLQHAPQRAAGVCGAGMDTSAGVAALMYANGSSSSFLVLDT